MADKKQKVFVGMSGGVDSSVTAALLKQATPNNFSKLFGRPTPLGFRGYDVVGVHMKCWSQGSSDALRIGAPQCGAEQDAEDARRAAEVLGIPCYVFDFEKEYKDKVVQYMVDGYKKGITPNPDVMCNKEIKFGLFLDKALKMGADYVATGHYVRLRPYNANLRMYANATNTKTIRGIRRPFVSFGLYAAKDANKDQSYFLWTLTQKQLKHCLFPIGGYKKPEVRKLAKKFGLPNADKKDSQGVCFLGQITLKDFLGNYLPKKRGLVLNTAGEVVGEHEGAHFYTIGQRHLGANYQLPITNYQPKRLYIAEKDVKENAILVAEENHPALYQKEIVLRNVNFINPQHSNILQNVRMLPVLARVRYRQPLERARLILPRNSALKSASFRMAFARPIKFVASGQSAVFYGKNGIMLGGGVIV